MSASNTYNRNQGLGVIDEDGSFLADSSNIDTLSNTQVDAKKNQHGNI